jgi:hypothetical protein
MSFLKQLALHLFLAWPLRLAQMHKRLVSLRLVVRSVLELAQCRLLLPQRRLQRSAFHQSLVSQLDLVA